MARLDGRLDGSQHLALEAVQVDLVAELGGEGDERLRRVVLAAVEAVVDRALNARPQGLEGGGDCPVAAWRIRSIRAMPAR